MLRNRRSHARRGLAVLSFTLSAAAAAAAAGALLGLLGSYVDASGRTILASLGAMLAVALGGAAWFGRGPQLMQCDRETPLRWVNTSPIRWGLPTGAVLGIGATTRIGFWSWYLVPAAAFLLGNPAVGAMVFGAYGGTRAVGGAALFLASLIEYRRGRDFNEEALWLIHRQPMARIIGAGHLVLLGSAALLAVGL